MAFSIRCGADVPQGKELPLVCRIGDVAISADEPVQSAVSPAGKRVFCFGWVAGLAHGGEGLARVAAPMSVLVERVDQIADPTRWTDGFEGRFILAVINPDGSVRVAADAFGKRDVFIQEADGGVQLASGMDALSAPGRGGYDQIALAHTLTYYGHRPPKRHTLYNAVRRLGVGEVVRWSNGALTAEVRRFQPVRQATFGARELDLYADLFLDHLAACGSNDGNVVYLSSGWDSTALLAGLVHVFGRHKVRAVVGRMRYSERSGVCNRFEVEKAAKIADYFGVPLDIAEFDHGLRGGEYSERAQAIFRDGHFFSLTGLNHMILAEHTAARSNGGERVFAGEISDGAHNLGFSQFVTLFHPSYEFRQYADKMASYLFGPTFARGFLSGRHEDDAVYQFFRARAGAVAFDRPADDAAQRMRQLFVSFFLRNGRSPLWSLKNNRMLTEAGRDLYTDGMANAYLSGTENAEPDELYSWYLHLYNSFHWQGSTVATLQEMAARNGLTADLPYWDGRLQQFLSAMPETFGRGLDLNPTKYPLKHMLSTRIDYPMGVQVGPHAYTYDVDPNFNHAVEVFYHSTLGDRLKQLMRVKAYQGILSEDVFDLPYIDSLVDGYLNGEIVSGAPLSDLISVALLCQTGVHG